MSVSVPAADIAWVAAVAVGVTLVLCCATRWLIGEEACDGPEDGEAEPGRRPGAGAVRPSGDGRAAVQQLEAGRPGGVPGGADHAGGAGGGRQAAEAPRADAGDGDSDSDLSDLPDDDETLAFFIEANAEHLVQPHEPETPGPEGAGAHTSPVTRAACPADGHPVKADSPGPGTSSDAPPDPAGPETVPPTDLGVGTGGKRAADPVTAGPAAALGALSEWVEQQRQQTVVDPKLPDWVAEALGCDSVTAYMERMTHAINNAS